MVEGNTYRYKVRGKDGSSFSGYTSIEQVLVPVSIGNPVNVAGSVMINFGKNYTVPAPWNNSNRNPVADGTTFENLKDDNNVNTGISIELVNAWGGFYDQGATTGNNSGIVPDNALKEYYWFGIFGASNEVTFKVKGLTPGLSYNLKLIGSSAFHDNGITDNGSTEYAIGTHTESVDVEGNTSAAAIFSGVAANSLGEIVITARKGSDAQVGYLNAMIVELPQEMMYAPAITTLTYLKGSGVNLTWDDVNTSESGYEVYRNNITTNSGYSLITTTASNITSFLDATVVEGAKYQYRLRAINSSGASGYSVGSEVRTIVMKSVSVNFGVSAQSSTPWNDVKLAPSQGLVISNLKDEDQVNTGIRIHLTSAWGGAYNEGTVTGDNSGIVPDAVLQEYYWFGIYDAPNETRMVVEGLNPAYAYNFKIIGSSIFRGGGADNGSTVYTIGSQSKSLYVESNTSEWVEFYDITPDTEGNIELILTKGSNTPAGFINALILEVPEVLIYTPTNFTANYVSGSGVQLAWNDNNEDDNGFEIYRTDVTNGGSAQLIATVSASTLSYTDATTVNGLTYSYHIRTIKGTEASVFSPAVEIESIATSKVFFNFSKDYPELFPWNNSGQDPVQGVVFGNLIDESGKNTGISIELLTAWGNAFNEGATTGNNSGVVPDNVLREYYFFGIFGAPNEVSYKVAGLTPGAKYNFRFVGSSVWRGNGVTDNGNTIYTIGTKSSSLHVDGNTSSAAEIKGIVANAQGEIVVSLTKASNAQVGYINAMIIEIPDVSSAYWPISNGNWTDAIWSHDKTASTGAVLPDGSMVNIEGRTITLNQNATIENLTVGAYNGQPGKLIISGAELTHVGALEVKNDNINNKIEIINGGSLDVRAMVRIMPIGNSITQGSNTTYSYRYELWKKLIDGGVDFDFVGSHNTNYQGNPTFPDYNGKTFDADNEGHWGWRADQILQQLPSWVAGSRPDIALLHVGTNDIFQGQSVASTGNEIRSIIDVLRASNPVVKILLAKVIPSAGSSMTALNAEIDQIKSEKDTNSSPIILVDQFAGISTSSDLYDGTHPNISGELKMADKWYQAILQSISLGSAPGNGTVLCNVNNQTGSVISIQNSYVPDGCSSVFSSSQKVVLGKGFVVQRGGKAKFSTDHELTPATPADILANWSFQYRYDARKRMIKKKVPGADWVYMVYDNRDRLVMTQDGNQRQMTPPEWTFTKYDALNRPILTGIYKDTEVESRDQAAMQQDVNDHYTTNPNSYFENTGGTVHGYTNQSFPDVASESDYLTVTYYDNYTIPNAWVGNYGYEDLNLSATANTITYDQPDEEFPRVIGQVTASMVKNLDDGTWLKSANYFDDKYRVVQVVMDNSRSGIDRTTSLYDFVGKVLLTKSTHMETATEEQNVLRTFVYDHAGRLLETHHKIDGHNEVLLTKNDYNELGQLVTKNLHSEDDGTSFKQQEDYRYNIRGWLTRINDSDLNTTDNGPRDYFGMNLFYNEQDTDLGNDQLFNGNISATRWSDNLGSSTLTSPGQRGYTYTYDPMNRLKSASHFEKLAAWDVSGNYFEGDFEYDLNGNIQRLVRSSKADDIVIMDELDFDYGEGSLTHSNKLMSVSDDGDIEKGFKDGNTEGDDYGYDANGNMVEDKNKDIASITYNHLNLPHTVTKTNGEYVKYIYDATGMKLRQEVYDAANVLQKKSDYAGEFFYEDDVLKFINHEEGRITIGENQDPEYQYHLKDHLGNVRLTFTTKEEVEQTTATIETANATEEQSQYLNYAEVRKINSPLFDHTNDGTTAATYYSTRLMGGTTTEVYGLARSLSVMPGDVISMEVYAKYLDSQPSNWSQALLDMIIALSGSQNPGGTFVDGGALGNIDGPFPHPNVLIRENDNGTGPKAYLNYILFDRDFNYLDGGFKRVTTDAREAGQGADQVNGVAHEHLFFDDITVTQAGYMYIYLSNENLTPVEVFFDDFKVEHTKSPVVQMDDYYPFGLTFNSYQRENSLKNKILFQGQEHIDALDLGWDSFKWRNHQPDIGRFFNVDPLAEKYLYNSPYAFSENKVVAHVELEGLEAQKISENTVKTELQKKADYVEKKIDKAISYVKELWNKIDDTMKDKSPTSNNPVPTNEDQQVGAPKKTDLPQDHDGNNDEMLYNPNATIEGGGGSKEVVTQTGSNQKVTTGDNPNDVKIDSVTVGGYHSYDNTTVSNHGDVVVVGNDTIRVHKKSIDNITGKTVNTQKPGTIQK